MKLSLSSKTGSDILVPPLIDLFEQSDALLDELEEIRDDEFAYNREEFTKGVHVSGLA